MSSMKEILSSIIAFKTHNGAFHADDVFSTAFLQVLFMLYGIPVPPIERVSSSQAKKYASDPRYIVYDVGGGKYDHHTVESFRKRDGWNHTRLCPEPGTGIPYASLGLLWEDFGREYLREFYKARFHQDVDDVMIEKYHKMFDVRYIQSIDGKDNHVPGFHSNITDTIAAMNLMDEVGKVKKFDSAVKWASEAFLAWSIACCEKMQAEPIISKLIENLDPDSKILVLPKFYDISEFFKMMPKVRYYIYPSARGPNYWAAQSVVDKRGVPLYPFDTRKSSYKNVVWVSPTGYMITATSKDDIIKACEKNDSLLRRNYTNGK